MKITCFFYPGACIGGPVVLRSLDFIVFLITAHVRHLYGQLVTNPNATQWP